MGKLLEAMITDARSARAIATILAAQGIYDIHLSDEVYNSIFYDAGSPYYGYGGILDGRIFFWTIP